MASLSIDVYADIAWPWCYVGRAQLRRALERRPERDVALQWRPFQLQPDLPPDGRDFRAVLEAKFGSWQRAQQMFARIQERGKELALTFDFDAIETAPNTADAHRLVLWADEHNRSDKMATALFQAYFSEGRNVSDRAVLADVAEQVGGDAEAVRSLLAGNEYAEAVRESQRQAQRRGVTGVPCYVFEDKHVLTGAQPVEAFVEVLDTVEDQQGR